MWIYREKKAHEKAFPHFSHTTERPCFNSVLKEYRMCMSVYHRPKGLACQLKGKNKLLHLVVHILSSTTYSEGTLISSKGITECFSLHGALTALSHSVLWCRNTWHWCVASTALFYRQPLWTAASKEEILPTVIHFQVHWLADVAHHTNTERYMWFCQKVLQCDLLQETITSSWHSYSLSPSQSPSLYKPSFSKVLSLVVNINSCLEIWHKVS